MSRIITEKEQENESRAKVRLGREKELDDVRAVLSTPGGRRFIARLLSHCSVSRSIWEPSAAIHRNAGIQEVGHYILSEVVAADSKVGSEMLVEAYESELKLKGARQ